MAEVEPEEEEEEYLSEENEDYEEMAEEEQKEHDPAAITGILRINDHIECFTLFDTGAIQSILSLITAEKTGLLREQDPSTTTTVHTLAGELLSIHGKLSSVPIRIGERTIAADFIDISMSGYEAILGMDWLTRYKAQIDCCRRSVRFSDEQGNYEFIGARAQQGITMISAMRARKGLPKGTKLSWS
ncbi:PREDICTED: DNA damage-inducible protein 1-like [Tarenaya hassleriana]|uniref:DNA damage-inducible protein 1-like n=1 Tax=Tarenaya hassleriana TaxID=28532 RepID=UPI00053C5C64|nr:PREDICTED: DNA damage-inducible protein 1-like [Tarenaya hassleriana]